MNLSRRILLVHANARARRRLMLVLVEAGYDVRAFGASAAALTAGRSEWFDLALVDFAVPEGQGFDFARRLRQAQPTLPIIMLLPELELPLIIEGIRLGLTDVLASDADPRPVLRRVHTLLRPSASEAPPELTADDLAQVEEVLSKFDEDSVDPADAAPDLVAELREDLAKATRERAALEAHLARVVDEKKALVAELQAMVAQSVDAARMQAELAQFHAQRAAEPAIVPTLLPVTRVAPARRSDDDLELERQHLMAVREDLRDEDERLREEAVRLRQQAAQLAQERRRWHDELEQLREREENLRAYEQRLRDLQTRLELSRLPTRASILPPPTSEPPAAPAAPSDPQLQAEWDRLRRASTMLESERAMFRDERMALKDLERTIHEREQRLRDLEAQVTAHETVQRLMAAEGVVDASDPKFAGVLKALSRAPFSRWSK